MRVVVTGGAGFIGSHLADAFVERGDTVLVVDNLSSGNRENVPDAAELAEIDVADAPELGQRLEEFSPDLICHLAAQASVTVSVTNPDLDFASNVRGTFNVCQVAARLQARVLFASTGGALYGNDAPVPSPETLVAQPLSPYGASKLAGEAFVSTEAGVVAIFSDRLLSGETPIAYGYGKPTRDYVHVTDVTRAFLLAADRKRAGTFNIGWGKEVTVLELLDALQRAAGTSIEPKLEPLRPGELDRSAIDSTAAAEALGWRPEISLEDGVAETYRWYADGQTR
jgi:UDP-glucose 4-epimerase